MYRASASSGAGVSSGSGQEVETAMTFRSALAIHLRVIAALIMREMATRYGRSAGGYAWALLEPGVFILMMAALFSQIAHKPPLGENFGLFYATGYMAFHFYFDISTTTSTAVEFNRPLFSFPRVTPLDTVLARFALQFLTCCFVAVIILGGMMMALDDQIRLDLAPLFAAIGLASFLALGVSALNCVLFAYSPTWQRTFLLINRPLFLISGIFFLHEDMPQGVQDALWWNPLVHVTALMRAGFYPVYDPVFVSVWYVVACAGAPLIAGAVMLRVLKAEMLEA
jgi:capsular polysaccharide transport system permease protein